MKKLRCDKPYDIDEARKRKGLPRRKRKDTRATAYELTIRIPGEYRAYFDGKKKLTRTVFALNKKDDLKSQVEAFEAEKNDALERKLEERGWRAARDEGEPTICNTPFGDYVQRYIDIRSNGAVGSETLRNERNYTRYVKATLAEIPICDLTSSDIENCLLAVPDLSRQWAEEKRAVQEENRKAADWCKRSHRSLTRRFGLRAPTSSRRF